MSKLCYLAGPMRGRGRSGVREDFTHAAGQLREAGWQVMNPTDDWPYPEQAYYADVVRQDLDRVQALCPGARDAIVLMPGYELSTGARAELAVARWLGVRALLLDEALADDEEDKIIW